MPSKPKAKREREHETVQAESVQADATQKRAAKRPRKLNAAAADADAATAPAADAGADVTPAAPTERKQRKPSKGQHAPGSVGAGGGESAAATASGQATVAPGEQRTKKNKSRLPKARQPASGSDAPAAMELDTATPADEVPVGSADGAADTAEARKSKREEKRRRKKQAKKLAKKQAKLQGAEGSEARDETPRVHAALEYLRRWKHDRKNWKFMKVRQTYLLRNLYHPYNVRARRAQRTQHQRSLARPGVLQLPKEDFAIMREYLEGLQGMARDAAMARARAIVEEGKDPEAAAEPEDTAEGADERRKALWQIVLHRATRVLRAVA